MQFLWKVQVICLLVWGTAVDAAGPLGIALVLSALVAGGAYVGYRTFRRGK